MSPEYRAAVLKSYLEKRKNKTLSSNLIDPQSNAIKAQCIAAFKWYRKTDDDTLELFFGKRENEHAYKLAIKNETTQTFRAINNFLNDKTPSPNDKTIALLAFLIDYEHRPYTHGWKAPDPIKADLPEIEERAPTGSNDIKPNEGVDEDNKKEEERDEAPVDNVHKGGLWEKLLEKKSMIALAVLLLISGGVYFMIRGNAIVKNESAGCMIWNKDQYEKSPCIQTNDGRLIVPLDPYRLAHLKKITDTSKIDRNSIGHTWYFGFGRTPECFTAAGPYPPDTTRRLLPMTKGIIRKYFHW